MNKQIYVWDLFVRLCHWALVGLFIISYITGEEEHWIHSYSGYAIFALITLRVIWGFIGSRYARFKSFVHAPATIISYLKSMVSGSPKRYLGHNPAGGAMIVALLAALFLTTLSGMKLYAIEEGKGPFAQGVPVSIVSQAYADSDHEEHDEEYEEENEAEEFWEEIHETSVNIMLLLITLHVIGVLISSKQHNEILVKSMVTGYKNDNT